MRSLRVAEISFFAVLSVFALVGGTAKADVIWTAYNDCIRDAEFDTTAENATD